MTTARELLQQADTLMRRNRAPENPPADEVDIPVLTDAVEANAVPQDDAQSETASTRSQIVQEESPPAAELPALAVDDVPVLTDVVEEIEAPPISSPADDRSRPEEVERPIARPPESAIEPMPLDELLGDMRAEAPDTPKASEPIAPTSLAEAPETPIIEPLLLAEASETPRAGEAIERLSLPEAQKPPKASEPIEPLSLAEVLGEEALAAPIAATPPQSGEPTMDETPSMGTPPSAAAVLASIQAPDALPPQAPDDVIAADDDERWDELAEEIRMQVLQRIDIFTDTGLREQLTARLQPIVDRASADLVATINQHVGQLLRAYVAEAIEREIEKWRQQR